MFLNKDEINDINDVYETLKNHDCEVCEYCEKCFKCQECEECEECDSNLKEWIVKNKINGDKVEYKNSISLSTLIPKTLDTSKDITTEYKNGMLFVKFEKKDEGAEQREIPIL